MADSDSGAAGESPALFNPETMSGISPGRRTQAFQRFRVRATGAKVASGWRRLLWKEPEQRGDLIQADLEQFEAGLRQWERCDLAPLLAPNARALADLMVQKLAESGQEALLCGTCAH